MENTLENILNKRLELLEKIKELHDIRSVETGKLWKRAHNCKTLEDREALVPELTVKNLEISQQLETLYAEVLMLDETIIHDIIKVIDL